jgi:hypothetical protein
MTFELGVEIALAVIFFLQLDAFLKARKIEQRAAHLSSRSAINPNGTKRDDEPYRRRLCSRYRRRRLTPTSANCGHRTR